MYHVLPMDPKQPLFLGSGSLCAHESKAQTGYPLPWQWESPGVYGGDYVVPPHGGHAVQPPPPAQKPNKSRTSTTTRTRTIP